MGCVRCLVTLWGVKTLAWKGRAAAGTLLCRDPLFRVTGRWRCGLWGGKTITNPAGTSHKIIAKPAGTSRKTIAEPAGCRFWELVTLVCRSCAEESCSSAYRREFGAVRAGFCPLPNLTAPRHARGLCSSVVCTEDLCHCTVTLTFSFMSLTCTSRNPFQGTEILSRAVPKHFLDI